MACKILLLLTVSVALLQAQNRIPCGFACTRQASFFVSIDNVATTATCTVNGADPRDRCGGCCGAYALSGGLSADLSSGFPGSDGSSCVCCTYNDQCRRR